MTSRDSIPTVLSNKNVVTEDPLAETSVSSPEARTIKSNGSDSIPTVLSNKNVVTEDPLSAMSVSSPGATTTTCSRPSKRVAVKRVRAMIHYIRQTRKRKEYYKNKDVEAMKKEHAKVEEEHTHENCLVAYIQSVVFGGVDGIITSFAVVAAIVGAGYSTFYILAIGIANLIADALSMGLGDYLSSDSEIKFAQKELAREKWEYDNYREGEESEMVDIFKSRGMTQEDAETVIRTTAKYKDVFCDEMMVYELGLAPADEDDNPIKKGVITFAAFIVCGIVPLLVYMFVDVTSKSGSTNFYISIGMTAAALFILGALKSMASYVTWYRSGLSIMVLGCIAAAAAYGISAFAEWAVGSHEADENLCNLASTSDATTGA